METVQVDVCVCTFRRPEVVEALRSLAAQDLPRGAFRVIVVDNDETPSARERVEGAAAALDLAVTYVHAPAGNISIARNACLEAAKAPWIAFMDDDEQAAPGWLAALLAFQAQSGADVVFGPVQAIYAPDAPAWAKAADLHSVRPTLREGGGVSTGYTCNVLFRRAAVGETRFDLVLGRTGGEDTTFFDRLTRSGAVLDYAPEAMMWEKTAPGRTRLNWLLVRSFRSGQTHARLLLERGGNRLAEMGVAAAKALFCLAQAALSAFSAVGWRRALVRGALHVGVAAKLAGLPEPQLYGSPARAPKSV